MNIFLTNCKASKNNLQKTNNQMENASDRTIINYISK